MSLWIRDPLTFSAKGQMINILGLAGQMVCVLNSTMTCCESGHSNTLMNEHSCIPVKFYRNRQIISHIWPGMTHALLGEKLVSRYHLSTTGLLYILEPQLECVDWNFMNLLWSGSRSLEQSCCLPPSTFFNKYLP